MPIASPQVFGDQTDVPESGDWWNSAYLIIWGTNLPITRTPDAHFMTEARYRGQKVVVVSPDFSDHTKFADDWLACAPGTDGALAMAMGHVILTEFFRDRQVPYFTDYVKTYTDLPFLVTLRERGGRLRAGPVPDRRGPRRTSGGRGAPDRAARRGDRRAGLPERHAGVALLRGGQGPVEPGPRRGRPGADSLRAARRRRSRSTCPASTSARPRAAAVIRRGVPAIRLGGRLVTTVFDLLMAQYAVPRDGLPGRVAVRLRRRRSPYTPAWQEGITSVPAAAAARVAREFARNAELSQGRSMIAMGAGHQPLVPLRPDLPHVLHADDAVRLPGRERRRLGALRRAGEGAAADRVPADRVRRWTGSARPGT